MTTQEGDDKMVTLYVMKAKTEQGEEVSAVEGTNFFKALSYFYPKFDNDKLLSSRNISKDGSLHEGTKIRSYLLKQTDVKTIEAWNSFENDNTIPVKEIMSADTLGMYRRNKSLNLYCGDFVDKSIEWLKPYTGDLFKIKTVKLSGNYSESFLNKVKDASVKQFTKTRSLF